MSELEAVLLNEIRMEDKEDDVSKLHNRLNPPGALGLAYAATGGMNTGYFSGEQYIEPKELGYDEVPPESIAAILSTDNEMAERALRYLESCEDHDLEPLPVPNDLFKLDISLEDSRSRISEIIKNIIDWLVRTSKALFDDMTIQEISARAIVVMADNYRIRLYDNKDRKYGNKPLLIRSRVGNLCVKFYPINNISKLINAVRVQDDVVFKFFSYSEKLANQFNVIRANAEDLEGLKRVLEALRPSANLSGGNFIRENNGDLYLPHLLGNVRLVVKTVNSASNNFGETVRLVLSDEIRRDTPDTISFERFSLQTTEKVLKDISACAKFLLKHNTFSIRQKKEADLNRLVNLLKLYERQLASGGDVSDIENIINYLNQYMDWYTKPNKELYGLVCRNLKAVLNVCELNTN